jgi:hypothetical protein
MTKLIVGLVVSLVASACVATPPTPASQGLEIVVLSSPRPDLVSGGDALIEVRGSSGPVSLTVNGLPSSALKADRERGSYIGLVPGLKPGPNALVARAGIASAQITITNHSKDGPILSGPHMWPYECRTEKAGLGLAVDKMCNAETRISRFYRSMDERFKPLPDGALPADLKTTTTIDGRNVPYVVRVETGTLNRSIYRIAMLDDPGAPQGEEWKPGAGWNGRLIIGFGGGLAGRYEQEITPPGDALNDLFLSRGFAFVNASGLVNGLVSNAILQGETLMMLKEHFIERYGVPRWTAGSGGSGGAIQQINITGLYPGLLDGLQAGVGFADSQVATHVLDCDLLQNYWSKADASRWTDAKKRAVSGFASHLTCQNWKNLISGSLKVKNEAACGLTDRGLVYDATRNPGGARCGMYPWLVNQLGRDARTGFPLSPLDNVGLQYGLKALNDGDIAVDEFLDLNERVGGYTSDMDYAPTRTASDPVTMQRLYASGLVNPGGGGLGQVPIISWRTYQDPFGDIHDRQRDFEVRYRLIASNGDADNQIIWVGPKGRSLLQPTSVSIEPQVLDVMTAWLDAIASDPAPLDHAKVVRLRPAAAVDAYFDDMGAKHAAPATMGGTGPFNVAYPVFTNPRIAAGGPLTNDVLKCSLKPVDLTDYVKPFTPDQAARLRQIFPDGTCDFSKPGVGQIKQTGAYIRY